MIDQLENQLKRKAAKISRAREVLDRITNSAENVEESTSSNTVSTMNSDDLTPSVDDDSLTLTLKLPAKKKNKTESNTCSVV
jgi:hypothetical protein